MLFTIVHLINYLLLKCFKTNATFLQKSQISFILLKPSYTFFFLTTCGVWYILIFTITKPHSIGEDIEYFMEEGTYEGFMEDSNFRYGPKAKFLPEVMPNSNFQRWKETPHRCHHHYLQPPHLGFLTTTPFYHRIHCSRNIVFALYYWFLHFSEMFNYVFLFYLHLLLSFLQCLSSRIRVGGLSAPCSVILV